MLHSTWRMEDVNSFWFACLFIRMHSPFPNICLWFPLPSQATISGWESLFQMWSTWSSPGPSKQTMLLAAGTSSSMGSGPSLSNQSESQKFCEGKKPSFSFPWGLNLKQYEFGAAQLSCRHKRRAWNSWGQVLNVWMMLLCRRVMLSGCPVASEYPWHVHAVWFIPHHHPINSDQFWHHLPGERVRSHRLRAQAYRTAPLPTPHTLQMPIARPGCYLCFWRNSYRPEVLTTLSSGSICQSGSQNSEKQLLVFTKKTHPPISFSGVAKITDGQHPLTSRPDGWAAHHHSDIPHFKMDAVIDFGLWTTLHCRTHV